jgi:ATP-binding cassette, subfamily B (MDR/TAP), member 1
VALVFFYGARLAKNREFPVGDILHAFSLITFSTAAANGIISYMPQLASSVDTGSRLLRLSRLPLDSHEFSGDVKPDPSSPTALMGPIEFTNLTFYYPTRPQTPALDRLSFTIPPRICTAIVGSSGSGKSTIASLLLKLYPTTSSHQTLYPHHPLSSTPSLTIGNHDIRTLHTTTLRGLIAVVPQTPTLFPLSVRENICYGLSPHSRLRAIEKVKSAAKQAGVHDFILSYRYNTKR